MPHLPHHCRRCPFSPKPLQRLTGKLQHHLMAIVHHSKKQDKEVSVREKLSQTPEKSLNRQKIWCYNIILQAGTRPLLLQQRALELWNFSDVHPKAQAWILLMKYKQTQFLKTINSGARQTASGYDCCCCSFLWQTGLTELSRLLLGAFSFLNFCICWANQAFISFCSRGKLV